VPTGARPFRAEDFPGYVEAVTREQTVRGVACLGLPEKICGLEVLPLTSFHCRWLSLIRSPFLLPGVTVDALAAKPGIVDDVMAFLWIISPQFQPGVTSRAHWWQRRTARDQFNRAFSPILKHRVDNVCREILEYVEETYLDFEPGPGETKSYFADEIAIAHELHEAYGFRVDFWHADPIANNPIHIPLKLVFQFRKLRHKLSGPGALVTNKSETLICKGLQRMNNKPSAPDRN